MFSHGLLPFMWKENVFHEEKRLVYANVDTFVNSSKLKFSVKGDYPLNLTLFLAIEVTE